MNIYIEVVVIGAVVVLFLGWSIWYNHSTNKLRREYDNQRRRNKEGSGDFSTSEECFSSSGLTQLEGRKLLPPTKIVPVGENSSSIGSTRKSSISRIFKRK